eukprot:TRINITY_DN6295_c0_g2_i1.p1 TRINITY_DN6295_c0_g2~~TRINITY_DN6295_c0_g2_i1.p1  ORF type:complete len:109 (-),score=6.93 TRINITY_DN6295_c0_g2_i1:53-379(-)
MSYVLTYKTSSKYANEMCLFAIFLLFLRLVFVQRVSKPNVLVYYLLVAFTTGLSSLVNSTEFYFDSFNFRIVVIQSRIIYCYLALSQSVLVFQLRKFLLKYLPDSRYS